MYFKTISEFKIFKISHRCKSSILFHTAKFRTNFGTSWTNCTALEGSILDPCWRCLQNVKGLHLYELNKASRKLVTFGSSFRLR